MKNLIIAVGLIFISTTVAHAQNGDTQTKAQPPNGLSQIAAYSLFYENYQNKQYKPALRFGRWILKGMPKTIEGYPAFDLSKNLARFATIYGGLAKKNTDPAVKEAYIDSVKMIYDKVFSTFSEDEINYYNWYLNQGRFYQQHTNYVDNANAKSIEAYSKAFELKPKEMTKNSNGYYVKALLKKLAQEGSEASQQKAQAIMKKAEPNASEDLKSYFDKIRGSIFDSPKERIAFLEKEVQEEPENVELLTQLRDLYKRQGQRNKVQELNQKLYELDPSYETISALANSAIQNANYSTAIKFLKEAQSKTDDPEKLKAIYLNLSNAYLNQDQLQQARQYARKAIDTDSDWGRPYLKLATIYARAVNNCTNGRKMKGSDRVVYWLVLDYLNKAKSVDSSVSNRANQLISTYRPVTPSKQDVFFKGWEQGQSISVDGSLGSCYAWINETTTVR